MGANCEVSARCAYGVLVKISRILPAAAAQSRTKWGELEIMSVNVTMCYKFVVRCECGSTEYTPAKPHPGFQGADVCFSVLAMQGMQPPQGPGAPVHRVPSMALLCPVTCNRNKCHLIFRCLLRS